MGTTLVPLALCYLGNPQAASANPNTITVNNKTYTVGYGPNKQSWDTAQQDPRYKTSPWWNDRALAKVFSESWNAQYGAQETVNFAYELKGNIYGFCSSPTSCPGALDFGTSTTNDNVFPWAFGAPTATPINPAGNINGTNNNVSSNLNSGQLLPQFEGGTLTVDQAKKTYTQDFTLPQDGTIDLNNNQSAFSGTFTGTGKLTITNTAPTVPNVAPLIELGTDTNSISIGGLEVTASSQSVPAAQALFLGNTIVSGNTTINNFGAVYAKNTYSTNNLIINAQIPGQASFQFAPVDPSQRLTVTNDLNINSGLLLVTDDSPTAAAPLPSSLEVNIKAGRIDGSRDSTIKLLAPTVIEIDRDSLIAGRLDSSTNPISDFDGFGKYYKPITLRGSGETTFANTSSVLLRSATTQQRAATSPDLQIEGRAKINSKDFKLKRYTTNPYALDVANGNLSITSTGQVSGDGVITANVWNEGNLSPGNSIGTLTVDGNYFQALSNPNAALNIEVNGSTSDLLKITGSSRVILLGGNLNISSYQGAPISSSLIYTAIDVTGSDPRGGELSLKTNLNVVGSSGLKFVRETDPDFATLSPAASDYYKICTNTDPSIQQGCTKLQFAWLKVNPQTSTPIIPTTISTPGVQTIQSVKQTGGAITTASSGNVAANNATCTSNSGSSANCQQINQPGTGSSGHNTNTIGAAKTLDAGWASLSAASSSGVSGGSAIQSPAGTNTGYTTAQTSAALVTPDFVNVIGALFSIPTRQQLNQALHSISAEPYASMQSVALEALEQFRANTIALTAGRRLPFYTEEQVCKDSQHHGSDSNNATTNLQTDTSTPCDTVSRQKLTPWSLLIDGSNTQASLNGTNDLASLDYNIFSSSYGLQYDFNRNWSAGAAFGYGRANLYNYEYSNARINSDTYSGAAWGIYRPSDAWKFTALAGYMNLQYDSSRNINFGGLDRDAVANWSGNGFTSALAAEYDWVLSSDQSSRSAVRIKPNTFFSYALHRQGAFSETGAQSLNLALDSHTADSLIYGIGFSLETPIITGKTSRLIPRLSIGYEYDFNGDSNEEHQLTSSFAEVPALGSFDVLGQNRGANAVDVALALEFETSDTLSLYSNVGGAFWSNGNELNYGAGLRLRW